MPLRTQKDLPKYIPGCVKKPMNRVRANKIARLQTTENERMMAYKCKSCGKWHTGRYLSPETIRKIQLGEINPPKKNRTHYKFSKHLTKDTT